MDNQDSSNNLGGERTPKKPDISLDALEIRNASAKSGQGDSTAKAEDTNEEKQAAQKKKKKKDGPVLLEKSYMESDTTITKGAMAGFIVTFFVLAFCFMVWKLYLYNTNPLNAGDRITKQYVLDHYQRRMEQQLGAR